MIFNRFQCGSWLACDCGGSGTEGPAMSQPSQASQLPQLDGCVPVVTEEISDKVFGLPLGTGLPSLRTPLQMQWSGVAARFTTE